MTNSSSAKQLKYYLDCSEKQLVSCGLPTARLDSELITSHALKKSREWVLAHLDYSLTKKQEDYFKDLVDRRSKHEPLAYITNNKEFFGRDFFIDNRVLVPRPETEDLISLVLENTSKNSLFVADIGTGSGVIGITLSLERPQWQLLLTDISKSALKVTNINAKKYKVENRIEIKFCNLVPSEPRIDLICANLPYVPNSFKMNKDLRAEPPEALFSGEDGQDHYKKLLAQIDKLPYKPKFLAIETLSSSQPEIIKLASKTGYTLKDKRRLALFLAKTNE